MNAARPLGQEYARHRAAKTADFPLVSAHRRQSADALRLHFRGITRTLPLSMIPKGGNRVSDKIILKRKI